MQDSNVAMPRKQSFDYRDAIFFAASFIFIYSQLFQFPFTPIYFEGDNLVSVSNTIRMLDGEVIYLDFFHLTPPGAELVYAALFSVFGVKVWVLNAVILLLGLAQVALLWFFSRKTLTGIFVYLPAAVFLVIGYRQYGIDGTYRLFSVIGVLLAVAVLFDKRTFRNLFIAGCLCGLASFFVQTRGVVGIAGIALFLLWENYSDGFDLGRLAKNVLMLTLPFALVVVLTHSYFAWQAGFDNYYFALVEFLQKHYGNDPLAKTSAYLVSDLPYFQGLLNDHSPTSALFRYFRIIAPAIFYYLLIPFVYIVFLIYRRFWKAVNPIEGIDAKLMLVCLAGLTLAAGVSVPTAGRLYHVAIPALVILFWLVRQMPYSNGIGSTALLILCLIGSSYSIQRQIVSKKYLDMPAGRSAFLSPETFEIYNLIKENTKEGDLLFEAQHPSFYFPFHLKNPTQMSIMRDSEYTPRFQVEAAVAALEKDPPNLIVWDGNWSKPVESRLKGDNLEILWKFIETNYRLEAEYPVDGDYTLNSSREIEIWKRKGMDGMTPQ